MAAAVLGALALMAAPAHAEKTALDRYVHAPSPAFEWTVHSTHEVGRGRIWVLKLRSQRWQGRVWAHWLTVIRPPELAHPDAALLWITGGDRDTDPPDGTGPEAALTERVMQHINTWAVVLQQVPNQPLFEGLTEDDLLAHTFRQYLDGGEETSPALLPMVKSAVAAMDAATAFTKQRFDTPVKRYTVTGASKRGWTSWLTAAVDSRVQAIAPIVFDMLHMRPQLRHQKRIYGQVSQRLKPYKERGVLHDLGTERGEALRRMMDPFAYRERLTMPKLALLGTNDSFWALDAARYYASAMQPPMHLYYQANTGHRIRPRGVVTLGRFHQAVTRGKSLPPVRAEHPQDDPRRLRVHWNVVDAQAVLWRADAPTRDFREAEWRAQRLSPEDGVVAVEVARPERGHRAYYVEMRFPFGSTIPAGLSTQVTVLASEADAEARTQP